LILPLIRGAAGFAWATGTVLFLEFGAGEFAHVHGDIVFLEDFAAEEVFHYVFHRDDAGGRAELIDDDEQLLMGF
jgi:hypothetical protein